MKNPSIYLKMKVLGAIDIAPGRTRDQRVRSVAEMTFLDEETGRWTPRGQQILDHTPMGEFGNPKDLIGVVFWLLSPSARFVHGVVVPIDGRFSAYSGV